MRMNHIAHLLDDNFFLLQPVLILFALFGWGLAFVGILSLRQAQRRRSHNRGRSLIVLGFAIFGAVVVAEFASTEFIKHSAWEEIRPKLFSKMETVSVNGSETGDGAALVAALRETHATMAHHSHPTTEYWVILDTSRGPLYLRLCRDSDNPHEYWVYYSGFHTTKLNELGRAFTDALDRQ
jgi:hypothetical protein